MAIVRVADEGRTIDAEAPVVAFLEQYGIAFERWQASRPLGADRTTCWRRTVRTSSASRRAGAT
jgi:cupin superfamily acireductone dioxygenase involved in methionine salvage